VAANELIVPTIGPGAGANLHGFLVSAYEAYHAEVYSFLARATRDRAVAEDLLQETFVRLAAEARAGQAPLEVRAWLYRTATSLVVRAARRQATPVRRLGRYGRTEDDQGGASSPEAGLPSRERAAEMERVLEGLSLDARLALLLSGAGFTGDEIATAIDRTSEATRTLLGRARARVRIRRDLFAGETP
jgi:RNA polymerase sigma-70 factor (ECF subfamily)